MNKQQVSQKAEASLVRARGAEDVKRVKGVFKVEHIRGGKVLSVQEFNNGVTNVGKDSMLDIMFHATTQITAWYLGLIDDAGTPTLAATDTMASHPGWAEFTNYSEANRVAWAEDAASGQSITNSVAATFNISGAGGTVHGPFLVSNNTKSGSTGTLWATAAFAAPVAVSSGDQLKVTYTVSLT
jgi:hypothetical protein